MGGQRAVSPKTSPLRQRLEAALRDAVRSREADVLRLLLSPPS